MGIGLDLKDNAQKQISSHTPTFTEVKDSGVREEFSSGAVRDTQVGKGRYDLIPTLPLRRLACHYENGAAKYSERNWERGMPLSRYLNSAIRHMENYKDGLNDEDHLAAVAWNIFAIIFTEDKSLKGELSKEFLDIGPNKIGSK